MPLKPLPPGEAIRRLRRAGFVQVRQRGSHIRFSDGRGRNVTVAVHARDIPGPVIRRIIQQAGISEQEWGNL